MRGEVDEWSPGVASESNIRSVQEMMGQLCRSRSSDGGEMDETCLNGGSCTSVEDEAEEGGLVCRLVTRRVSGWMG